jgi:trans-aconitate 2-methyltransferase
MISDTNAHAGKWNAEDYAQQASAQRGWANELIEKLALKGHEALLDIGCGDGSVTDELASRLPAGSVTGIDASESMIALARKNFSRRNLTFTVMDATDLHLERKFDIAFSNATLHWVKDHTAVLKSLRKHLNPRAKILFQMGGDGNAVEILAVIDEIITSAEWREYYKGFRFPYYFYAVEPYEHWLPESGYKAVRIQLIPKDMVHPGPEGLIGWLRTTWFPYTDRLPEHLRENFLSEIVSNYLKRQPLDAEGKTHVAMVRLEVEARVR